jgi:peroxiredoxin
VGLAVRTAEASRARHVAGINGVRNVLTRTDPYGPLFALPTTFIIGRDGRICQKHVGLTARDTFEHAIKQLIAGN